MQHAKYYYTSCSVFSTQRKRHTFKMHKLNQRLNNKKDSDIWKVTETRSSLTLMGIHVIIVWWFIPRVKPAAGELTLVNRLGTSLVLSNGTNPTLVKQCFVFYPEQKTKCKNHRLCFYGFYLLRSWHVYFSLFLTAPLAASLRHEWFMFLIIAAPPRNFISLNYISHQKAKAMSWI